LSFVITALDSSLVHYTAQTYDGGVMHASNTTTTDFKQFTMQMSCSTGLELTAGRPNSLILISSNVGCRR